MVRNGTSTDSILARKNPRALLASGGCAIVGCLITFPALIPAAPPGLRTSEIISLLAIFGIIFGSVFGHKLHRSAVPLAMAFALSAVWIIIEISNVSLGLGSSRARMILVRWILSLPCAYWLGVGMTSTRHRRTLALGIVAGTLLSFGTVYYDQMTFDPSSSVAVGEGHQPVWVNGQYRASGIFSHPNAAAGVVLLAVPFIIGLIEERRLRRICVALPIVLTASVFSLTMTRGPTLVAVCIIVAHLLRGSVRHKLAALLVGGVLAAFAWSGMEAHPLGAEPLMQRMTDVSNIEGGARVRSMTTITSIEIAITHPFGVGSRYEQLLEEATGYTATHNGYVQLALLGGFPLMLFVAASLFGHGNPMYRNTHKIEAWTALYIAGALMFENQFFISTFSVLTLWLLWDPARDCPAISLRGRFSHGRQRLATVSGGRISNPHYVEGDLNKNEKFRA